MALVRIAEQELDDVVELVGLEPVLVDQRARVAAPELVPVDATVEVVVGLPDHPLDIGL